MKVIYEDPKDRVHYCRWREGDTAFDIWYERAIPIRRADDPKIPAELQAFLQKWCDRIEQYKKTYREAYPVKMAKVEFIYKDEVYAILPPAVSASYETDFMSDTPYLVSWDSLLEAYEGELRADLRESLGVARSRYFGMLD